MNRIITLGVLIFITVSQLPVSAQQTRNKFKGLDISNGLSNNSVTCFLKDRQGFLWFGTVSGLNRYDGYTIKVFRNDPRDTSSLLNNNIVRLSEGPDSLIWITTADGVAMYDPKGETFIRHSTPFARKFSLPDSAVDQILKDHQGNYWFIHATRGLFKYQVMGRNTVPIPQPSNDPRTISDSNIASVCDDANGNIWVLHKNGTLEKINATNFEVLQRNTFLKEKYKGAALDYSVMCDADGDLWIYMQQNNTGVFYFDADVNQFTHYQKETGKLRLNTNIIKGIVQDNAGLIWIGTDHGGINLLNKKSGTIQYLLHDEQDKKSLRQNSVNAMYKDDKGTVWVGTYKHGIDYYHEDIYRFPLLARSKEFELPFNDINQIVEDSKGNLWLAANGGGLIYYERRANRFKQYLHDPADPNSIGSDILVSLLLDEADKLWVGTYFGGLSYFNGERFITYKNDARDSTTICSDSIWEIFEDEGGNLWIGTMDGGLDMFDRKKGIFKHYSDAYKGPIQSSYVSEIIEDRSRNLWIGTASGLDIFNRISGNVIHFSNRLGDTTSLSSNIIQALCHDSRGIIWIGTQEGLCYFEEKTKSFKTFTSRDGLPGNSILSILEDEAGNLWMSTPNGITEASLKYEQKGLSLTFRNFDVNDGLQGIEFNEDAACRTKSGELIFAGANGLNIFHPQQLVVPQGLPKVVFTDLYLFNKRIRANEKIDGEILLDKSITITQAIVLEHDQNFFAIEFSALDYFHSNKIQYSYKLAGFNEDWITTSSTARTATYTNLDPGTYTFMVKAAGQGARGNGPVTTMEITILPPFWKTTTAWIIYAIATAVMMFTARRVMLQQERNKFQIRQERFENQRIHELDKMKIKFFTNVSHEFRTPLTLILTPLETIIQNTKDESQLSQFQLIQRNAKRLLNLVNQLLDFRKVETSGLTFNPSYGEIVQFIKEATYTFSDLAEKKDIHLSFHTGVEKLETYFDQDKTERILFNLLSNAFKFTPQGGSVDVRVSLKDEANLQILVKDSGIGIPQESHEKIFERFFQHALPPNLINQGSGIGLSITKEFVKIHGGSIEVTSAPGNGSCFLVSLTLKQHLQIPGKEAVQTVLDEEFNTESEEAETTGKPIVLLIEDSEDFRFYLKDNLKEKYQIVEASNGKEGWDRAVTIIPDLIISDVMMPELNGIELCRQLKLDQRTSHIPVVLLTARSSTEQKLEGYQSGVYDYIVKPFNFEILESRIRNIILQKQVARQALQRQISVQGSNIEVTSLDEKLVQRAIKLVEQNISDPEFSVEALSKEVGMSRIHLYRKLHAITGKSPLEFIRTIRLQRAAQLLEKSQLTVSEIAYQVGFNNPKYFTRYFKEEFKCLPSAFAAGKTKKQD